MLVLSRRLGETLMIGDEIEVVLLGVHGQQLRLGIKAPPNIAVHRLEVYQRIKAGVQLKPMVQTDARCLQTNTQRVQFDRIKPIDNQRREDQ